MIKNRIPDRIMEIIGNRISDQTGEKTIGQLLIDQRDNPRIVEI
jgi:hypothetical protein